MMASHFFPLVLILVALMLVNAKLGAKEFMICGGVSTAVTDLLLFPMDTIKVTQQSSKVFMTSKQALREIFKTGGGMPALYKGALGYAAMDGIGSAIFFAAYERAKRFTAEGLQLSGPWLGASVYVSAAAAFGVSSILLVPAELVKARMQTQTFRTLGHCLKDAVARERGGIFGVYTGYAATMIRDLPYFALQLGFYDNIRDALTRKFSNTNERVQSRERVMKNKFLNSANIRLNSIQLSPAVIDLMSGISAGALTGLLTNPMDVVTARLMTQKAGLAQGVILPGFRAAVGTPYRGLGDCVARMMREEGARSFLMGVKSRVCWIAPFTAISLGLNNVLRRRAEEQQALRAPSPPSPRLKPL